MRFNGCVNKDMNSVYLNSNDIKAKALRLGFSACGMARALPLDAEAQTHFGRWIATGAHAGMDYMARHTPLRMDPSLLVPGARTVISVALPYRPAHPVEGLAWYAHGKDYHMVMKERLQQLLLLAGATGRCFVDTAPMAEKYWAWQCGLGWQGRHSQLVIPDQGSTFFLGELVVMEEADHYDVPMANRCGSCHRCVDACPSHALDSGWLDARRCLSYLTIEHRGPWPEPLHLKEAFYGCDQCSLACPHASHAPCGDAAFQPSEALLSMTPSDWHSLTEEQYRLLFKGSAVKRAKYDGLMRNIRAWNPSAGG